MTYADISLEGDKLRLEFTSNLPEATDATLTVTGKEKALHLEPGRPAHTSVDLGPPEREATEVLAVEIQSGAFAQRIERKMRVENTVLPVASLPDRWKGGMRLRGQEEKFSFADTRAHVGAEQATCGRIRKRGLAMHPPWVGGVGYVFALYEPITLPAEPGAFFRALVGKRDGSDPGDGILYKVSVINAEGKESIVGQTLVEKHEWASIEGDLSDFAGKTIRIKLISDVGENDDSTGDWACWAEMRIETVSPSLIRILDDDL